MAYAIVHHFADGTKEQYEAALAAVHPGPGQLPDGQTLHVAGPGSDGGVDHLRHPRVQRELGAVPDEILGPALTKGVEGGFTSPPQERTFEVDTRMP